jgi:hypothetical protein
MCVATGGTSRTSLQGVGMGIPVSNSTSALPKPLQELRKSGVMGINKSVDMQKGYLP